jgi:hypothetical protein
MKTPAEWAALTIVTETNQPHEMLPIAWVLRYRVASPRFPDTMQGVVLQERQFSAWNPWTHGRFKGKFPQEEIWHELWKTLDQQTQEKLYPVALDCALNVLGGDQGYSSPIIPAGLTNSKPAPSWSAPFGPEVCWYYSPVSMVPAMTAPTWAATARRTFTPSGIEPARFVFCEAVG